MILGLVYPYKTLIPLILLAFNLRVYASVVRGFG